MLPILDPVTDAPVSTLAVRPFEVLSENPDQEERTQTINEAVGKLLADFPPYGD